MLTKLIIKNVALIESAEIDFTCGLNVLSGETGAGKSVIIESLNFVLGDRADKTLIRSGETECFVRAEFDVSKNSSIDKAFLDADIEKEEDLIITRRFTVDGKSTVKVNGNTVTVSMLKNFTSQLIDVHGQSEHFHLLKTANQLKLLDDFAGDTLKCIKTKLQDDYNEYKKVKSQIISLGGELKDRETRLDVLNFQVNEIESAEIFDGEQEDLMQKKQAFINKEKLLNLLNTASNALSGDSGASDLSAVAERAIIGVAQYGDKYSALADRISSIVAEIDDVSDSITSFVDELNDDENDIDYINDRLELIKRLYRKYGGGYAEMTAFLQDAKAEIDKLQNFEVYYGELERQKNVLEEKIYSFYKQISDIRRLSAQKFTENITVELDELGLGKSKFTVNFNQFPSIDDCKFNSSNGIDEIEFMFSANLGEPLKTLSDVISGGEMSRFMIAIKAQTAKFNDISTFIFDEIDAGISGVIAKVVAKKLAKIAKSVQVVAISHLPQIACMSDNSLLIEKGYDAGKTKTKVYQLDSDKKVDEIVRLVGGEKGSESAKKLAEDLINEANEYKMTI